MKVLIVNTGEALGTRIFAGPNEITDMVSGVEWSHDAGEMPKATLHMDCFPAVLSDVHVRKIALHGRVVRRIEYEDGSADEFATDGDGEVTA
jgi:hypothetical protein